MINGVFRNIILFLRYELNEKQNKEIKDKIKSIFYENNQVLIDEESAYYDLFNYDIIPSTDVEDNNRYTANIVRDFTSWYNSYIQEILNDIDISELNKYDAKLYKTGLEYDLESESFSFWLMLRGHNWDIDAKDIKQFDSNIEQLFRS